MSQSQERSPSSFLLWTGTTILGASLPGLVGCQIRPDLEHSTAELCQGSSSGSKRLQSPRCLIPVLSGSVQGPFQRCQQCGQSRWWSCCLCLLWAEGVRSRVSHAPLGSGSASSASCRHQRQNPVLWHSSRHGTPAARLDEGRVAMGVGRACVGGPRTGHLL